MQGVEGCEGVIIAGSVFLVTLPIPPENTRFRYRVVRNLVQTMPVRIIVCGGRDYADRDHVFRVLDKIHTLRGIAELIQGDAPGADTLAKEWAEARGIKHTDCPADWNSLGRRAGPIRNRHMLTLKPDGVVAFSGGRGTLDMITAAQEAGVPVYRPSPSGQPNPPTR